jgi:radical SAM protein with 4Fe4S-binding SPASM domain
VAPDPGYNLEHFVYDQAADSYTCSEGHTLHTNGHVYTKNRERSHPTSFRQYRTKACKTCAVRDLCTSAKNGKLIERNLYSPLFEQNRQRIAANPELYKRRQAIVEHPFGTIKRQWGYSYVLTKKGMARAAGDVGLMLAAYNLRRIFSIVGWECLLAYLRACIACIAFLSTCQVCWQQISQIIKWALDRVQYLQIAIFNQPISRGY